MQQLTLLGKNKLRFLDAPDPELQSPTDVIVRPFAAARCDVETAFFRHGLSPLLRLGVAAHLLSPRLLKDFGEHPFAGPMGVGHECIGQVIQAGSEVKNFKVGDRVVVPYQISCGSCVFCARGRTAHCETDRPSPISAFGGFADPTQAWGGVFSDAVRVPFADHMLVEFPDELDPVVYASASDNMADAYRAVAPQLKALPGAPVLVVGGRARSIGLYAVSIAKALGVSEVVYADWNEERLNTADKMGATVLSGAFRPLAKDARVRGKFPITVEASGKAAGLHLATEALSVCGTCTVVALHWAKYSKLPLWDMYSKNLTVQTGMVDSRMVIPGLLELGLSGRLDAKPVISTVASWSDAPDAMIEKSTKVIIVRAPLQL